MEMFDCSIKVPCAKCNNEVAIPVKAKKLTFGFPWSLNFKIKKLAAKDLDRWAICSHCGWKTALKYIYFNPIGDTFEFDFVYMPSLPP